MNDKEEIVKLVNCPDCGVKPGEMHLGGCDIQRCSVCGDQLLSCGCLGHDRAFARWTGIWPGYAESRALGIDLNGLYDNDMYKIFFIKPKMDVPDINELVNVAYEAKELMKAAIDYLGEIVPE